MPLGLIQPQSSDPMAPGYNPIFQTDWTPDTPAQGATQTGSQDTSAWDKAITTRMKADDATAGAAPKQTGLNPGPTTWQQISTWATAHQTELIVAAGMIGLIILLLAMDKERD